MESGIYNNSPIEISCRELATITGLSIEELSELDYVQHTNADPDGINNEQLYFFSRDNNPIILNKIKGLDRFYCLRVRRKH